MFEVVGSALAQLAVTPAGQALLRAAGVMVAPEVVAAGAAVYLGYKGVQFLIDYGVLPQLPGFSPPPVPTSPPLVQPAVDSPPEALVPPPVPGQVGNEGFTATPPVAGNEGLVPDGPQRPQITTMARPKVTPEEFGKRQAAIADKGLPIGDSIPYVPPAQWMSSQPLPRGEQKGYLDVYGNEWVKPRGIIIGEPHWDVQTPDGGHLNVKSDGEISH